MLISAILFCLFAFGISAAKDASDEPLSPEGYSLYSAIYENSGAGSDELLGIAASPLPFPCDLTCLQPSRPEERRMEDIARHQAPGRIEWKQQFDFGSAYILISATEVIKAINCIGSINRNHVAGCERYSRLAYVRFLSIPIFNKDHTRALVAINRTCGGLCGNGGVFVYRRTTGGWELEKTSFASCHWVS